MNKWIVNKENIFYTYKDKKGNILATIERTYIESIGRVVYHTKVFDKYLNFDYFTPAKKFVIQYIKNYYDNEPTTNEC